MGNTVYTGPSKKRFIRLHFLVLIAIIVMVVSSAFILRQSFFIKRAEKKAKGLAESVETFIPADLIEHIDTSDNVFEDPAYMHIKESLILFQSRNEEVAHAYLCTQVDGKAFLLADSTLPGTDAYMPPGREYGQSEIPIMQPFIQERSVLVSSASPAGTIIQALVPVKDPQSGDVVAVFGVTFSAAFGRQEIDKNVVHYIVIMLSLLLLLAAVYGMVTSNKTLRRMGKKLQSSETLFRTVFEQAPVGIAIGKGDQQITDINPVIEKILGRAKEDLVSTSWTEYTHPDDHQQVREYFHAFSQGNPPNYSIQMRCIRPDEALVWANMVVVPLQLDNAAEHDGKYLCLLEDITDRINVEKALLESERSKAVLLSHLPGMAYRCSFDRDWTMQYVSDGCITLTGYKPESLLSNNELSYNELIAPEYRKIIWDEWKRVVDQKRPFRYEYKIIPADGNRKWVLELGQGIYDDEGNVKALEGIVIDITEQKVREAQIQYMGDHDYMTGLYNRKYFEEVKRQMDTQYSLPLSIIVADINSVRLINDAFGYAEGDRMIVETAYVIRGCCRKGDILARTGANEFSILMPNTDHTQANDMVQKINRACEQYNETLDGRTYTISLSMGFSTMVSDTDRVEHVAKAAEDHMYNRKLLDRKSAHSTLLSSIMATMYERSHETEEHAERLASLSKKIGKKLNLPQKNMNELELLSMLHDIGKVGINDSILNKPGELSGEEWNVMKKHPEIGYRIAMTSPELQPIVEYILSHHERWDGTGYPRGLKGDSIPLLSRILAVVDAYDAMTADRVYRKAMTVEEAIEEIRNNTGTQFDPEIARIFIESLWSSE